MALHSSDAETHPENEILLSKPAIAPYLGMAYYTYTWRGSRVLNGTMLRTAPIAQSMVPFRLAQAAFLDPRRVIAEDLEHSGAERRYFCFGMVGGGIMTVRFTHRGARIRIFGAGYWRKGKRIYEQQNRQIHHR